MSGSYVKDIKATLASNNQELELIDENLVDKVWKEKPRDVPERDIIVLDTSDAGRSVSEKLEWLRNELKKEGAYLHVVSALDAICCTSLEIELLC